VIAVEALTERQQQVLDWVREYIALNRIPPTRAEIGEAFGFQVNAADQHVRALAAKGALELIPNVSRGIVLPPPTTKSEGRARK
jgi:repressor LexA